ncbi:MAG: cobalt-precorrin-5B (C(1))-methyltransferase [Pseudomonadota bacterium]
MAEARGTDNGDTRELRRGWTTGACATAATKAAWLGVLTGRIPTTVGITLPKGQTPSFEIVDADITQRDTARAAVVKDAGDDPDVTHGAKIVAEVSRGIPGSGVIFRAGDGVGIVTKPGLPISPGEPAINPVPRALMTAMIQEIAAEHSAPVDAIITIHVPGGAALAQKTWNPRLGIEGGISILGTTGIVVPYSCAAWIHSIHRGIDVARALETLHVAACVGSTSERMVQNLYDLPTTAFLDMGDFAGGMLKYLRRNPVPAISIAGGFGKFTKLAQGALDLHSSRSQVDPIFLSRLAESAGGSPALTRSISKANTALDALQLAQQTNTDLATAVAEAALTTVRQTLGDCDINVEILIADRDSRLIARAGSV